MALGCNPVINSKEEIDRSDLILPPQQEKLIQKVHAVNPNVVLMLLTNYPYAIGWEQENLPAIEKDFYAGTPVLTKNRYGAGSAWYVASRAEQDFYADFVGKVSKDAGIVPVWEEIPGVEVCIRENETHRYLFFLNHSGETVRITPEEGGDSLLDKKRYEKGESFVLEKKGVMILRRECGKQGYRE